MTSEWGQSVDDNVALSEEAERLRSSGTLGEARVRRLFDYLVTNSLAGQAPKEIAIAIDVFGKSPDFDVSQDAVVRVYVHKLRKALEEFYDSRGAEGGPAMHIPRGEYRLRLSARAPLEAIPAVPVAGGKGRRLGVASAAAGLGAAALIVLSVAWLRTPHSDLDRVRASPIWSAILNDDRPIMIVVGDYYLVGETDDTMGVKRLIREYSINSKSDLDNYVAQHPEVADRYMDVGLRYLPIASAFALRDVMVVLAPENRRITVSKMSDVEPRSLKSADIVYIGYLSGMGMLQDIVFAGSRFAVGESYDEVIDKKTHHSYVSEIGSEIMDSPPLTGKEKSYQDYGMFAKFRGPGGNTIVVISGTRDEGVSQTAEAVTSAPKLDEFAMRPGSALPIEALLAVSSVDGVNLSGKLLIKSNRDGADRKSAP
jgi:hypothetical protein